LEQLSPHRRQGLRILLTNVWMTGRGGSESVTRDLATGLIALGHSPTVYTPIIGQSGFELEASGVPVIDDLRLLKDPPDVIHGHHSVPTVEAIVRFPRTPVVNVCHAWAFGIEAPVSFPQVQFHVGVDEVCTERIAHSPGIDPSRIYLIPNGVELKRIPPRRHPLPSRPQKAVAFGKATALLPILLGICADMGIELEVVGPPLGRPIADPEEVLAKADLVFASARAALEAVCAGCVVVVCDARGVAGRATTENYKELRSNNFGLRCLTRPVSAANLRSEIESYDAGDAEALAGIAREDANIAKAIDQYLQLYRRSIEDMRLRPVGDDDYTLALSGFLRDVLPRSMPNPARSSDELGRDVVGRLLQLAEENFRLKRELSAARG